MDHSNKEEKTDVEEKKEFPISLQSATYLHSRSVKQQLNTIIEEELLPKEDLGLTLPPISEEN